MSLMIVNLPKSYKRYLRYPNPSPGIKINEVSACIIVSIYETELSVHCQSNQAKASLKNALQSLQSISELFPRYKGKVGMAKTKHMVKAISRPLNNYLRFDSDKYFDQYFFQHTLVWMLLLAAVSILVSIGLAIPFVSAIYLIMLVSVSAVFLGLITAFISHRELTSRRLEMAYKKLIEAIETVNKEISALSKDKMDNQRYVLSLEAIEEVSEQSSSSSLMRKNNRTLSDNSYPFYSLKRAASSYIISRKDEAQHYLSASL